MRKVEAMAVKIVEVKTPRQLKAFVRFPVKLYRNHPCYVPNLAFDDLNTLRRDKNAAFEHCEARYWLAYNEKNEIVGRVAAIINHLHREIWGENYIRFGWIDFIDDIAVSSALLGAVEDWGRAKGMCAVHGPLGFTDMDREGMLVEGFDELGTLTAIYNYPYYPEHLAKLGYTKDTDWVEYEMTMPDALDAQIPVLAKKVLQRYDLRILSLKKKKDLLPYAHQIFHLINDEYKNLYGFVQLSEKQIEQYIQQYFGFVDVEFIPIILDRNGQMVAFGITIPSLSRALQKSKGELFPFGFIHFLKALKKNDRADLYLVAVSAEYQGRGLNAVLINQVFEVFKRMGIKKVESNPELETNQPVQSQWKYFERRQHKRRRCFIKKL